MKPQGNKAPAAKQGKVTTVGSVKKSDTKALITNGSDAFPDDSFEGMYYTGSGGNSGVAILEPFFKPGTLHALCVQNNILSQCVEAMEVNIDGTGHSIELIEDAKENEVEKTILTDFFKEPYPGKSMIDIRRPIRRDLEESGNGYIEVIRNVADEVVMINDMSAETMRLIRLDDPVPTTRMLTRGGKEIEVSMRLRERRFVQLINGKKLYFKEFGAGRDLNRDTGVWANKGTLPLDQRASEVIHLKGNTEPKTPYGVPRWINQLPSVLGSRKAEEHNLDFFDAGGLPPVLVIVQGGTLGDVATQQLKNHLLGAGTKNRAAIVEAVSTSGTLESSGSVQVRVERFGAERQQDAMFQQYDKNCEDHVRCSFRLPPLFLGKAADFNFATAKTAYMVAEAQVFFPERDEFDSAINTKLVRALGVKSYRFRSLPLTLVDVDNQLKALQMVLTANIVEGEEVVGSVSEITGLTLTYQEPPAPPTPPAGKIDPITGLPYTQPAPPPAANTPEPTPTPTKTPEDSQNAPTPSAGASGEVPPKVKLRSVKSELVQLAALWASITGMDGVCPLSESMQLAVKKQVDDLDEEDRSVMNQIMAVKAMKVSKHDVVELGELCGCAAHAVSEAA